MPTEGWISEPLDNTDFIDQRIAEYEELWQREVDKIQMIYLIVPNQDAGTIDYLHVFEKHEDDVPVGSLIADDAGWK